MAKTDLLTGDVRVLTLKIAAPSVAAMLAASVCPLLEALVLSARDASLSAAVGAWPVAVSRASRRSDRNIGLEQKAVTPAAFASTSISDQS